MNNIKWILIVLLPTVVAIIAFLDYGNRIWKSIFFSTIKSEKRIIMKIIDWYKCIDESDLDNDNELRKLEVIENELNFIFSLKKNKKFILNFNNRFIRKFLKYCGIKKEFQNNKELFKKYARLNHPNIPAGRDL
jgi:hypothetical protein